ncbi:phosphotyrosine protein phosphatase [Novosphingobium sp. THN1]|uniref:low molecular weight protein-tyrosine-phosphatase n=1 Tax=unclassified Novosphingobium TaxID=2644732 RepID=UPI000E47FDAA|nr:low molecular weight protein-tyrosine-phosphatase [Novosphingobium sp. THN1]AXU17938.1 phosphotyrosine protein phosphatase [Novosphingobium sp. THN1]MBA4086310.1 phosphotyrosine protein phosphatase [Novosphingobium sp.]NLR37668.1 low molecular weight phosphotyrosine protein phosphatase [Novosphingobium sp. ERW19]
MSQPSILFVCLGNICRSPLAEAALRAQSVAAGVAMTIDSAGIGDWHVGRPPDPRAQETARRHGLDISSYRARQVTTEDFTRFGHIFALDQQNLKDLRRIEPSRHIAEVALLMDLVPGRKGTAVIDPYYGDEEDFEQAWADVSAAAERLVRRYLR